VLRVFHTEKYQKLKKNIRRIAGFLTKDGDFNKIGNLLDYWLNEH
jgi:hypothetical protein